jgi:uncharacterized protein
MQQRDHLGRPLRGHEAEKSSFPQVPEREDLDGPTAWNETIGYFHQGLPFHMHEVCEQRWRCAPPEETMAWKALAQWGAALTHEARGNHRGAQSVALRAQESFLKVMHLPHYVDQAMVNESIKRLLA